MTTISLTPIKRVAHATLSTAKRPLGRRRLESLSEGSEPTLVNIGAGRHRLAGWLNTDVHWRAEAYLDLMIPWPISADRIYGDNVIEHFTVSQARTVLRNAYAALRPGGGLRLATPDVEAVARSYLAGDDICRAHLDRNAEAGYSVHYPVDLLRITFAESGHHLGYCHDYQSLRSELALAGFTSITRARPCESDDKYFRDLESRTSRTEAALSLIVEAWKEPDALAARESAQR